MSSPGPGLGCLAVRAVERRCATPRACVRVWACVWRGFRRLGGVRSGGSRGDALASPQGPPCRGPAAFLEQRGSSSLCTPSVAAAGAAGGCGWCGRGCSVAGAVRGPRRLSPRRDRPAQLPCHACCLHALAQAGNVSEAPAMNPSRQLAASNYFPRFHAIARAIHARARLENGDVYGTTATTNHFQPNYINTVLYFFKITNPFRALFPPGCAFPLPTGCPGGGSAARAVRGGAPRGAWALPPWNPREVHAPAARSQGAGKGRTQRKKLKRDKKKTLRE